MPELSVIIPARNERFLNNTIQDVLAHSEGDTEVIAVLDGQLPVEPIPDNPRLSLIIHSKSIGQRAATNEAAKLSSAKYLMKIDAHCSFDQGFDVKMMRLMEEDITMVPVMRNLHAFDWVCENGHRRYQGPSGPCTECGKPTTMDVVWVAKTNPQSTAYRFDTDMHFQYENERKGSANYKYGVIMGYALSYDIGSEPSGIIQLLADFTSSHHFASRTNSLWFRENVPVDAVSLSTINGSGGIGAYEILGIANQAEMGGVATTPILADMVNNGNIPSSSARNGSINPSVYKTMNRWCFPEISNASISSFVSPSNPVPATGSWINSDLIKELESALGGHFIYSEKSSSFHNGSVTLNPIVCKDMNETMSLQGSCFMCTRDKYFELDLCSEDFNSWGQQGVEVACKTWLSGGRVLVNRTTWYAHMFRTQGSDFSFPYENPQSKVVENRNLSKELFAGDKWDKEVHSFNWLIDKFDPPGWKVRVQP
jgi:hypothetical protein